MAMGDPGQLELADLAAWLDGRGGTGAAASTPPGPWTLGASVILMANFEVPHAKASRAIPSAMTQPLNAYGRVIVLRCEDSPVGPFAWAQLIVAGRFSGALPRDWIVDWIAEGDGLLASSADYAFPVRVGQVSLEFDGLNAQSSCRGPRRRVDR